MRIYIPYGYPWLPFPIRHALRHPRTAQRLAREAIQRRRPLARQHPADPMSEVRNSEP